MTKLRRNGHSHLAKLNLTLIGHPTAQKHRELQDNFCNIHENGIVHVAGKLDRISFCFVLIPGEKYQDDQIRRRWYVLLLCVSSLCSVLYLRRRFLHLEVTGVAESSHRTQQNQEGFGPHFDHCRATKSKLLTH